MVNFSQIYPSLSLQGNIKTHLHSHQIPQNPIIPPMLQLKCKNKPYFYIFLASPQPFPTSTDAPQWPYEDQSQCQHSGCSPSFWAELHLRARCKWLPSGDLKPVEKMVSSWDFMVIFIIKIMVSVHGIYLTVSAKIRLSPKVTFDSFPVGWKHLYHVHG